MRVAGELLLLEINNIETTILSSDPKHAAAIAVDRNHIIITEATGIAFIVLKMACEGSRAPIEVIEAQVRRNPESIFRIVEKSGAFQSGSSGTKWICIDPLRLSIVLDEPDRR